MSNGSGDPTVHFRNLIAGYTDAIRVSDFKANIGILFVAFMMGPILGSYTKFPYYLPIPLGHVAVSDGLFLPAGRSHAALSQARPKGLCHLP